MASKQWIALFVVAALVAVQPAATASTPSSGKLDRKHPSVRWAGGPLVAQNWANECPEQERSDTLCDRFSLEVPVPSGPTIDIQIHPTDSSADLNVRVLDAAGAIVAEDLETELSATVRFKHRRGASPYTIEVVPYSTLCVSGCPVTGTSYEGQAQLHR